MMGLLEFIGGNNVRMGSDGYSTSKEGYCEMIRDAEEFAAKGGTLNSDLTVEKIESGAGMRMSDCAREALRRGRLL